MKKSIVVETTDFDVTLQKDWEVIGRVGGRLDIFICSNSLYALKKYIREETRYKLVYIQYTNPNYAFSYGQQVVEEYPYCPRRYRY